MSDYLIKFGAQDNDYTDSRQSPLHCTVHPYKNVQAIINEANVEGWSDHTDCRPIVYKLVPVGVLTRTGFTFVETQGETP